MMREITNRLRPAGGAVKRSLQRQAERRAARVEPVLAYQRVNHELAHLRARLEELGILHTVGGPEATDWAPFLSFAPPGHFYSPIPLLSEVERDAQHVLAASSTTIGIDLRGEEQLELFQTLAALIRSDWPFPDERTDGFRYHSGRGNFAYGIGDGMMLHGMLRHLRPRRLIEVGSGFSSALTIDTNERFLDGAMEITFIEPHPELLQSLVGDGSGARILAQPVQQVHDDVFATLESGDVLFLDTTHVSRYGSDVNDLFTRVIPSVAPGVVIHLHDVFWPFEYPVDWLREGRAWTEQYVLRSFLQFNEEFEILLFNSWLHTHHLDVIQAQLPSMLENIGGSIWLRRRA